MVEAAALGALGGDAEGRRYEGGEGCLRLLGQHQAAQPAGRIGEGRGDRVDAVEPDRAGGRLRARAALAALLRMTLRVRRARWVARLGDARRRGQAALAGWPARIV